MQDKRYIICGNAPTDGIEENPDRDLRLRLWGKDGPDKITLRIEDIHKKMSKDVPDSFQDLLEIATYVYSADQVVMFSGGLDSLAGAIDEVLNEKHKVVLVTHKSTPKLNTRHRRLEKMIADKAGENAPLHIGVRVNKNKGLNCEYTQRSRSFLYVSIGATIAKMLNLKSVRFYENGVISLNLPVCAQVVGGRATRTTHPRVIQGFQEIISLVAGEPFTIENPYIWKTKAGVIEVINVFPVYRQAFCHDCGKSRSI